MNQETITLTLIANAGVLIEFDKSKLLIDAIHSDQRHAFSSVCQEVLDEMLNGKGQLSNVDYLLFTHNHSDHFSPRFVIEYLKKNEIKTILLPKDGNGKYKELRNVLEQQEKKAVFLKLPIGKSHTCYFPEDKLEITVFPMKHMSVEYEEIENYCFLISIENRNLLFLADADCDFSRCERILEFMEIDVLFINPLFLNQAQGRDTIINKIRPKSVVVYHIPFEEDDSFGYRKIVKKDIEKYKKKLPPIMMFSEAFQTIELEVEQ